MTRLFELEIMFEIANSAAPGKKVAGKRTQNKKPSKQSLHIGDSV